MESKGSMCTSLIAIKHSVHLVNIHRYNDSISIEEKLLNIILFLEFSFDEEYLKEIFHLHTDLYLLNSRLTKPSSPTFLIDLLLLNVISRLSWSRNFKESDLVKCH